MDLTEKTVKRNYIYNGKILSLRRDDALLPDGKPCVREIVEHSGGAAVLYLAPDGRIPFVKQYRYAYGEVVCEIPAGKLEKGENPEAAALRELREEVGAIPDIVKPLQVVYPSPGYTDEKIYVYFASGGAVEPPAPDDGEFLEITYFTVDEAREMLARGEFRDAKTIIALSRAFG